MFILQRKGGVDSDTDPNEPLRRDRSQFPVRKGQWGWVVSRKVFSGTHCPVVTTNVFSSRTFQDCRSCKILYPTQVHLWQHVHVPHRILFLIFVESLEDTVVGNFVPSVPRHDRVPVSWVIPVFHWFSYSVPCRRWRLWSGSWVLSSLCTRFLVRRSRIFSLCSTSSSRGSCSHDGPSGSFPTPVYRYGSPPLSSTCCRTSGTPFADGPMWLDGGARYVLFYIFFIRSRKWEGRITGTGLADIIRGRRR